MSVWNWVLEFANQARDQGDEDRLQLLALLHEAGDARETEPDLALAHCIEGRALAERLGEPWWVLLFEHWRLQVLLHFKSDYSAILDLAVQSALEARKPIYARLPQRVCLHEDLIYCYVNTDPCAHADAIREALAFMEAETAPDQECRHCIQGCAATFALTTGNLDEADRAGRRALEMVEDDEPRSRPHHAMTAHAKLCEVAARREDWEGLAEHAAEGARQGQEVSRPRLLAEMLLWQALLARRSGNEKRANDYLAQATRLVARLGALPYEAYFDALCCFHEQGNEWDKAAATRSKELELLAGRGLWHRACRVHLARCRYLKKIGWLGEVHLKAARAAAGQLRDPAPWLAELERLL
jgi:hypothetical protein